MNIGTKNMRLLILTTFILFQANFGFGQTSLKKIGLNNGKYKVGFKHYLTFDNTRTYKRVFDWTNKSIPRPIPVSIWYPAIEKLSDNKKMMVLDYMEILKEEEEWEYLPNEQILNWFYYLNTDSNKKHLNELTTAIQNIQALKGEFPVVVYAPSYQASSIENFALCEYLVSHGYVVVSSPSRGTENRFLQGGTEKDLETQARDIEFLIKSISKLNNVDMNKIATMGFSFGGLSNVLSQMRNGNIKANVSLDGSIKYQYATLQKSPFYKIEKVNVPFIHMAQKDIPKQILIEDKIDSTLNNTFKFYDSLSISKAYSLKFNNLTHTYFSTLGVLFQTRDKRQDKSDNEIMESYKWVSIYALTFLNAFLKENSESLAFLERKPEDNGVKQGLITKRTKKPTKNPFSFEDFNDLAVKRDYKNLMSLNDSIRERHPKFELPEGKLNNLGLQLNYNPETSIQGINVFILATQIYPNSANLFDSLAEGYLFIGDKEKATENFKKSLNLNAQNQNAIDRLKQLK